MAASGCGLEALLLLAHEVSAVLVTRGDIDMSPIIESLPFDDIVVWDNSRRTHDLRVFGRYAGIEEAKRDVIYVQDDDCLLSPEGLHMMLAAYDPRLLIANMPAPFRAHYSDSCLVGFGALFHRELPADAFTRWSAHHSAETDAFARCCDVVFTTLTESRWCDAPYSNMAYAFGEDRMWRQPDHVGERTRMLDAARAIRDA